MVIGIEALGVGLGTTAFVAFIAHTTHPLYTATQFALFTSLAAVPRTFANAATGYLVEWFGWMTFFLFCFVIAIPGMLLLLKVAPWNDPRISHSALNTYSVLNCRTTDFDRHQGKSQVPVIDFSCNCASS